MAPGPDRSCQNFFDFGFDLGLLERLALNFVVAFRVHEIFGAQNHDELAHVHFRDQHFPVALDHVAQVARQRIQMAQMHVADAVALCALRFERGGDRAVGGAPGDDQQIAVGIARGNDVGNVLGDGFHFGGAQAHHFFVVQRLVVHVAGDVLLFQAADAVLEPGVPGMAQGRASVWDRACRAESPRDWFQSARESRGFHRRSGCARARRHWRDSRRKA